VSRLRGVISVLQVPFAPDGEVDWPGLARIASYAESRGAVGLAFGFASEYFRLTEDERQQAVAVAVGAVDGRVPVAAPCTAESIVPARRMIRQAKSLGASIGLVNPPSVVKVETGRLLEYFGELAAEGLPLMIQDAPQWTGVHMPVSLLVELAEIPGVHSLKMEAPPTWVKVRQVRELVGDAVALYGGYGGMYLLPELAAGSDGVMPSTAHPQLYAPMLEAFWHGDRSEATRLFQLMLPYLITSGSSLDDHIWLQKELLRRRGLISSSSLRAPASPPDRFTCDLALELAASLGFLEL